MRKQFRNVASVLVSIVLLGLLAQASASTDKNAKNEEHHSRMSKAAFWKHHKHQDKTAKPSPATAHKTEKQKIQPKTAEVKPVSTKKTTPTKNEKKVDAKASKPAGKPAGKTVAVAKTTTSKRPTNAQTSSFKE